MNEPLRVGVIGTGMMGRDHARVLADGISGATLTALADPNQAVTRALADELGVTTTFDDGHELIASGSVDAVIVATPDQFHASYTKAAVEHGLPVLCEKPLAPTVEEAAAVIRRARQIGGCMVTVGFMRRFDPGYLALKEAAAQGELGAILMSHSVHRNVEAYPGGDSSATITNSGIHEFDILPWLCDSPIVEVMWSAGRATSLLQTRHDPQFVLLRAADGVLHTVALGVHARYGYDVRCELVCESGTLELPTVPSLTRHRPVVMNSSLARSAAYPRGLVAAFRGLLPGRTEGMGRRLARRPTAGRCRDDGGGAPGEPGGRGTRGVAAERRLGPGPCGRDGGGLT